MSENTAETIAELAVKADATKIVTGPDGRSWLASPKDVALKEVTDPHGLAPHKPIYIQQRVTLQEAHSLIEYVRAFKSDDTLLLADIEASRIVALLDYHGAPDKPAHVAHEAVLTLPFSEEWKLWTGIDKKLMGQLEFARFIEENAPDVDAPPAADLLEAVRDLQANRKVNFIKAVRTASDNENFEYTEETETRTKGGIELPSRFLLKIPVYFGERDTELYAFLRWRLDDGKLLLGVQLNRAEHVRQAVFREIMLMIGDGTLRPVLFGRIDRFYH